MSGNIYQFIENFKVSQENFLEFVTTLCDYFSQKFAVRNCPVKICELTPGDAGFGKIPPAEYSCMTIYHRDETAGVTTYERKDESIKFSVECSQETNKARIVKLAAHEWMHFYNALFRWKELDRDEANEEYKDLIIKAIQYDRDKRKILKEKYNKSIFGCINKLSAGEVVADKHAQTFLKELYHNISDNELKMQIEYEMQKHEKQVEEYKIYLQKNQIDEDCIVK